MPVAKNFLITGFLSPRLCGTVLPSIRIHSGTLGSCIDATTKTSGAFLYLPVIFSTSASADSKGMIGVLARVGR